jgi:elongation factor P--(R)-beta-lysine ligase
MARQRIKSALRDWFVSQGFIEVEPAALQVSPGNETHLHAFATTWTSPSGQSVTRYLHTSPEFACKKLLAAGETRIFTFAPCFRNRELGLLHAPEFTMLEWYEVGADYSALMAHCREIVRIAAAEGGAEVWTYDHHSCAPRLKPHRVAVADIVAQETGIDLLATVADGVGDRDALARAAGGTDMRIADDDTWSDIFSRILVTHVEPALADQQAPVFLDRYPIPEAALARPAPDDGRVAERFELYCCGVELANGFGELTDAEQQHARFVQSMADKQRLYGERYPIDADFLAALSDMPAAVGCALGFDRLAMLASGARRIADVMWTPEEG